MSGPVLCVGVTPCIQRTLRYPRFAIHQVNRAASVSVAASGKGTNVSRALRTLEDTPVLVTMTGGANGALYDRWIQDEGLAMEAVRVEGETRICQTLMDEASGEVTELVEEMPTPSDAEWVDLFRRLEQRLSTAGAMLLSGRLPPGSPDDIYARMAAEARRHGVPVYIDSQREPLALAAELGLRMVKINAEELAATYCTGTKADRGLQAGIDRLLEAGTEWVLITRGAKPSVLVSAAGSWRYHIPPLRAVNPIGSGDCTLAGTVRGLREGMEMPEAVRLGLATGSANALTDAPAVFDPAKARELFEQIRPEPA